MCLLHCADPAAAALGCPAGTALVCSAYHIAQLVIGRLVLGVGVGFATQATPMYLSEMAPYKLRGALNILFQLAVTIGEMRDMTCDMCSAVLRMCAVLLRMGAGVLRMCEGVLRMCTHVCARGCVCGCCCWRSLLAITRLCMRMHVDCMSCVTWLLAQGSMCKLRSLHCFACIACVSMPCSMGDDPMALLGLEGALKHYYY
jgi:hypothetical protein